MDQCKHKWQFSGPVEDCPNCKIKFLDHYGDLVKYAELGRLAVEIMERKGFSCEFKYMHKTCETSIGMLGCHWELFCQKRAELLLKVGDKVIGRDNRKGVIEKIHDTGQILVKQSDNVWCTYDHAYMLKIDNGIAEGGGE